MSQNKKVYLEAIRIFAILGVIFNHTDGFIYYTTTENVLTWLYSIVSAVVSRTAVPLFFMVTGALLLGKEESLKELFSKRIMRMVYVLLTVSVVYYLFDIARGKFTDPSFFDLITKILSNDIRPSFWFLYEYIFLLMLLPFFRMIAPKLGANLMLYLVILRGIVSMGLPVFHQLTGISVKFDIGFGAGYIYYALLGYFLCNKGEEFIARCKQGILWATCIGMIILNVLVEYLLVLNVGSYSEQLLDGMVFLTAPTIWIIIRKLTDKLSTDSKLNTCIVAIGGYVFGIYLFDNFIRWQLLPLYLFLTEKTIGIVACSVYVMFTFGVGLVYTWLLKKIPIVKNMCR